MGDTFTPLAHTGFVQFLYNPPAWQNLPGIPGSARVSFCLKRNDAAETADRNVAAMKY
ncbi:MULTISPECIES: hypothetical protein [unclassified Neisseria]|uniref:hypothetical protein n=1 Tax=unclassified Neisseria TaxID=2623750 RepID=UPI001430DE53|nr:MULTISPECIES: hypothetical protein [unclassified Neisseria]MBF0803874.1 hypothetical protein [Neisseria sp. 19428wB4_WF04]